MKHQELENTTLTRDILQQLRDIPDDVFAYLRYIETICGCEAACAMCSQGASHELVGLTRLAALSLILALTERIGSRLASQRIHQPKTIYPYFASDAGMNTNFDLYPLLYKGTGARIRFSTTGIFDPKVLSVHERASQEKDAFSSWRLSFTGFPKWSFSNSKQQYLANTAKLLQLYSPLIDHLGVGNNGVRISLRFRPNVKTYEEDISVEQVGGTNLYSVGPYVLETDAGFDDLSTVSLESGQAGISKVFKGRLAIAGMDSNVLSLAQKHALISSQAAEVEVCVLANSDGPFIAINPRFQENGSYTALQLYPKTLTRKVSGWLDSSRYFMNSMIRYKELHVCSVLSIDDFLAFFEKQILEMSFHPSFEYVKGVVLPQIRDIIQIVRASHLPESLFFNEIFLQDTGVIENVGSALRLFRGLVSQFDEPLTPQQMRTKLIYEKEQHADVMGSDNWRLYPSSRGDVATSRAHFGLKDSLGGPNSVIIQRLGKDFYPTNQKYILHDIPTERLK